MGQRGKQINNFVITGASSDIGSAIAKYLDQHTDTRLVLVSRNNPGPRLQRRHIRLASVDLTNSVHLRKLQATVKAEFDGPFAVIHCVGDFWTHKPLIQTELTEISRMIASHYLTFCGVAWTLLPVMIENDGGRLLALSCNSVNYNYPDMAPFTAAKAALESFVKCLANEYSEFNVIANAIALPTLRTKKVEKLKPVGDIANYVQPEELAEVIIETLMRASTIVNGNTLKVFRYSPTFFHNSYFERNPRQEPVCPDKQRATPQRRTNR